MENDILVSNLDCKTVSKSYTIIKRFFDLLLSIVGFIIISPFFLVIITIMKCYEPKGKIFFKQKRLGKDGDFFYIYKFRSMKMNADVHLKSDEILYAKYVKNGYKLDQNEDPRITKLGKFLRKTSLDELPQLLNVIMGNMSLVGPRPIIEEELDEYKKNNTDKLFLKMKPGITGIWQTSGRSNVGYPERVFLELSYLKKQSIVFDIYILWKTMLKVLISDGAY